MQSIEHMYAIFAQVQRTRILWSVTGRRAESPMWRPARSSSLVPRQDRVSHLDLAAKWRHGPANDATPGPRAARVGCSKLASPPRKRTRPAEDDRAAVRVRGPRLTRPACRVDPIAVPAQPDRVTGVAGIAPEGTPEPAGTDRARVAGRLGTATQGTATCRSSCFRSLESWSNLTAPRQRCRQRSPDCPQLAASSPLSQRSILARSCSVSPQRGSGA